MTGEHLKVNADTVTVVNVTRGYMIPHGDIIIYGVISHFILHSDI